MTIKEIANLAGVSPSTVSKIINGKHDEISEETRERVLKVVKEYNYAPYAHSLAAASSKTLLIGILLRDGVKNRVMLDAILRDARSQGYGVVTCISRDAEEELKNVSMLLAHRVDGILWQRCIPGKPDAENELSRRGVPFFTINPDLPVSRRNLGIDFHRAGYLVTEALVEAKHHKIACIAPAGGHHIEAFCDGHKQCLYDANINALDTHRLEWNGKDLGKLDSLLLTCTGFVCYSAAIAAELVCLAYRKNYSIPRDLSVVCLDHGDDRYHSCLSALALPYDAFGSFCCRSLIAAMENKKADRQFNEPMRVEGSESIDVPITVRGKRIVVVGALNMDTIVNVSCFPKMGETTTAKSYAILPGGKGANQAIGAAKLGAEVCLIGRRGRDFQGNALMGALLEHNIDVSSVKTDHDLATGHAYIYVQENGESSIVIYEGANRRLTPEDVERAASSFRNASFCLLQTEIHADTVECAAHIAKENDVKVLLKPAAVTCVSNALLRNVDIFMPNRSELNRLCPGDEPLEEKARRFLDRGAGAVIVTLAHEGCYLLDADRSMYFPAADFQPVDTTGAADAFAATLAVYLTEGRDIATAIRYANCAAGFSITHQGVPPSLVDKSTLELYLSNAE